MDIILQLMILAIGVFVAKQIKLFAFIKKIFVIVSESAVKTKQGISDLLSENNKSRRIKEKFKNILKTKKRYDEIT